MENFYFRTRVGTFWIQPQPNYEGRYWLGINDTALGSYASPMLAADDMYMHVTGWDEWDELEGKVEGPTDITEWRRGIPDL